jgi:hypothetical protein
MRTQAIGLALILMLLCPAAPAQWVQTSGPPGGNVSALASSGSSLFAAIDQGVFRSTNNGKSWMPVNEGLAQFPGIKCLLVSGTNVFAGTGNGLFRSTSNGASWTAANSGLLDLNGNVIEVWALAASGPNLIAGSYSQGVFLSTDNGTTWMAVNRGLQRLQSLVFSGTNLFAGTESEGVFLSTNNGTSWTAVSTGLQDIYGHYPAVNCLAVSGTNLFAGTSGGVFLSANNGTSWTEVNTGLLLYVTLIYPWVECLAVSGTNVFAGIQQRGIFRSTDNGTSWTEVNTGMNIGTSRSPTAMAVSGANIFAGTSSGVFLSTNNGTNWTSASAGLTGASIFTLASSGTDIFAGGWEGVFRSTNNGESWSAVDSGLTLPAPISALAISGTNLFVGTDEYLGYSGVFRSANMGESWSAADSGLTHLSVFALTFAGANLFAGTRDGVFLSTDNGTSWTPVNKGLPIYPNPVDNSGAVTCLAVDGTRLYAGTNQDGVFLSTNNGTSWTPVDSGLTQKSVYSLAVSGANLFAGTYEGGVFLSTDSGTSWTEVDTGLPHGDFAPPRGICLAVSGTKVFVGTAHRMGMHGSGDIFLSTNNGSSWTEVRAGLPHTGGWYPMIYCLAVSGNNLFAGTENASVWRRSLSEMPAAIEPVTRELPCEFVLHQNYPNPFNPNTGVRFQVPGVSDVKITVYDMLGREVATLVNERKQPGTYEATFDGSALSSGSYIYRMTAGSFAQSRKMLLVK